MFGVDAVSRNCLRLPPCTFVSSCVLGRGRIGLLPPLSLMPKAIKGLCAGGQWKEGSHWAPVEDLCGWSACEGGCQRQDRWEQNQEAIRLVCGGRLCCSTGGVEFWCWYFIRSAKTSVCDMQLHIIYFASRHYTWTKFKCFFFKSKIVLFELKLTVTAKRTFMVKFVFFFFYVRFYT